MKLIQKFILGSFLLLGASCEKDNTETPPQPSTEERLVAVTWKIEKIVFVQNNTLYRYTRGASGNDYDFTTETILFKKDLSGTYSVAGKTYNFTWAFTDPEKTKIKYIIQNYDNAVPTPGVNLTLYWDNVTVTSAKLQYAETYTAANGKSTMSSVARIPQ